VAQIFRGVSTLEESDTYLAIIDEGPEKQVKEDILELGKQRFGAAEEIHVSTLHAVSDLERLHRLPRRILDSSSWQDLLDTP
jgi:hypothetical protein